jgi:hypothetical protein
MHLYCRVLKNRYLPWADCSCHGLIAGMPASFAPNPQFPVSMGNSTWRNNPLSSHQNQELLGFKSYNFSNPACAVVHGYYKAIITTEERSSAMAISPNPTSLPQADGLPPY